MAFSTTSEDKHGERQEDHSSKLLEIRAFVTKSLMRPVADDDNFFETGFVTSMFGMQLITFLEQRYKIEVLDEDLDLVNFCTLNKIVAFVDRKLG